VTHKVSLRLRARRIETRIRRDARRILGLDKTVYVDQRMAEYQTYWRAAATLLGATSEALSDSILEIRLQGRRTRVKGHVVAVDDPVVLQIAGDKPLCHRIAQSAGVRVPEHLEFDLTSIQKARVRVAADSGPWVIKPAAGSSSALGVTLGVQKANEVERAAVLASLFSQRLLLERMVPGESCRLLYLDGRFISAVRRKGLRVIGDGVATMRQLMSRAGFAAFAYDRVVASHIQAQGLSPTTVPASGSVVVLMGAPDSSSKQREFRTIYDELITDRVSRELTAAMGRVVASVGSRFAGVDIVTTDPSLPLEETGGAFIELNTTPGIHHHYQVPNDHRRHPVAVAVLESLLGLHADGIAAD
jgi:cyanophycin synthetase